MLHGPVLTLLTPLLWATAALAWLLASGRRTIAQWPFYRPVAWLLTAIAAVDLARAGLHWSVLDPARAAAGVPYRWPVRVAFHLDVALLLAKPAGLVAVGLVAFLRRPWWPAAIAWAALCVGLAVAYPELRAAPLGRAFAAWSWACVGAVVLMAAWTYRTVTWIAPQIALLLLCAGESVAAYGYLDPEVRAHWDPSRVAYGTALVMLTCYQCLQLVRYWRR